MKHTNIILASAMVAMTVVTGNAFETMRGRDAAPGKYSLSSMQAPQGIGSSLTAQQNRVRMVRAQEEIGGDYVPAEAKVLRQTTFSTPIFENGEEGNPDLYTRLNQPDIDNLPEQYPWPAWFNLLPECFEDGDIWGGNNLFPAGGMGCLFNKKSYEMYEANIVIPLVDASQEEYEGIVYLRFKARAEKEGAFLLIEAAETNEMAPSWTIMGSAMTQVSDEWMWYEAAFYGGSTSVITNIYNPSGISIYVDDITVYQQGQPCQTPVLKPHSDYKGETWTANWIPAKGADGYLITVYSVDTTYDEQTGRPTNKEYTYLYQDEIVPGAETCSFNVTGAVSGQKYFYYVKSYRGTKGADGYYESVMQNEHMVVNELLPSKMHPVTDFNCESYTASWDEISGAEVYNYWARYEHKADVTGEFVITDDDFNGVVDGEGFLTGWTKENYDDSSYSTFYFTNRVDKDGNYYKVRQPGWKGLNCAPYTDYIALDAWQYIYARSDAGYLSPEFDLSKDGGKFTISFDCAGNLFEYTDPDTNEYISGYPRAAVALFNYNEEIGNYEQVALQYFENVKFSWKNAKFTFDKGSKRSIIGIYAVYAPEWLYIDNLKLTQNYEQGEMLMDPYWFERYIQGTSLNVPVPAHVNQCKLYHQVCGVKSEIVEDSPMGDISFLESPMTDLELIAGSDNWVSGVQELPSLSNATVQLLGDNMVQVLNPAGAEVTISDLQGRVVFSDNSGSERVTTVLEKGTYVVKAGTRVVKLTF